MATTIKNSLPGDILLTYGRCRFWPPKYLIRCPLYAQIRDYQKEQMLRLRVEHPDLLIPEHPLTDSTHVYVVLSEHMLFEFTYPRARFITVEDSNILKKGYTQCRWKHGLLPDTVELTARCQDFEGEGYDIGDLFDFQISGWLNLPGVVRIFGDRANKVNVCSTGLFKVLEPYGVRSEVPAAPAWFENVRRDWLIVGRHKR